MIEVYYSKKCKHCQEAMIYLDSRHIPFVKYDLTDKSNGALRKIYRDKGFTNLPIILHHRQDGTYKEYNGCTDKDLEEIFTYEYSRE
jgi:arsenate reductase-like glutaredoxin family protein